MPAETNSLPDKVEIYLFLLQNRGRETTSLKERKETGKTPPTQKKERDRGRQEVGLRGEVLGREVVELAPDTSSVLRPWQSGVGTFRQGRKGRGNLGRLAVGTGLLDQPIRPLVPQREGKL